MKVWIVFGQNACLLQALGIDKKDEKKKKEEEQKKKEEKKQQEEEAGHFIASRNPGRNRKGGCLLVDLPNLLDGRRRNSQ